MKMNEGPVDRIIRVIVGIALVALGLLGVASGVWMWVAYLLRHPARDRHRRLLPAVQTVQAQHRQEIVLPR